MTTFEEVFLYLKLIETEPIRAIDRSGWRLERNDMELNGMDYLTLDDDVAIIVTKGSIEQYALSTLINYLRVLPDGMYDTYRNDDSEWDKAIDWVAEYIMDSIKELEQNHVKD